MSRFNRIALIAVLGTSLVGCSGGGPSVPRCSLKNPAVLATSPWPKFRADLRNTGSVDNAKVASNSGQRRWMFPPEGEPAKGAFAASPVIGGNGDVLYIGSNDGTLYGLRLTADGTNAAGTQTSFNLVTAAPITSTALVGTRSDMDQIFVGGGDGRLYAVDASSTIQVTNWPSLLGGFLGTSPTISLTDGTIYAGG